MQSAIIMADNQPQELRYLALFRGINVGGKHLVPMKALCQYMRDMGCSEVVSYIQSGNLLFNHPSQSQAELEQALAALVEQHFGFLPMVLVLSQEQFNQVVANNPFTALVRQPKDLQVFFFAQHPPAPALDKLDQLKAASEDFALIERAFYLHAPDGIGRSKLVTKLEKYLGLAGTARNFNTIIQLEKLLNC